MKDTARQENCPLYQTSNATTFNRNGRKQGQGIKNQGQYILDPVRFPAITIPPQSSTINMQGNPTL